MYYGKLFSILNSNNKTEYYMPINNCKNWPVEIMLVMSSKNITYKMIFSFSVALWKYVHMWKSTANKTFVFG